MSLEHHGPAEIEATKRMLQEFLGNAKPRFPRGKVSEDDSGELAFAIGYDSSKQVVFIRFAKPVDWIGLDANGARQFSKLLNEHASKIPDYKP